MIRGCLLPLLILFLANRFLPDTYPARNTSSVSKFTPIFARFRRQISHAVKHPNQNASLTLLCLLLSGDIETNPGPRTIYPCGICEQEVTWQCKGICCDSDKCGVWFHHDCVNVDSVEYALLGRSHVQWLCPRCDSLNCDSFTFNSFELSCQNSYAPLASDSIHTVDSLSFADVFAPGHTSSPNQRNHSTNSASSSIHNRTNRQSSTAHSNSSCPVFGIPKKSNLRILNVNCQSAIRKRSEIQTALQYIKPDIVYGTESWLYGMKPGKPPADSCIASSEVFPDDYNVFRNDRSRLGGGVFIATHKSLTADEQPDLVTDCEINWVRVKLQDRKDLYAGVFYMPQRNARDTAELQKSLNKLTGDGTKNKDIILAGDFNCPDVNWDNNTVTPSASDSAIQQSVIDITNSTLLTQVHSQPTRQSNLLDLIFTTNPSLLKSSSSVPGISDHDMVVADFDAKPHITKDPPRTVFKFHKADWDQLRSDLDATAHHIEQEYNDNRDVEGLWTSFRTSLQRAMDRNIPQTTSKKRSRLPWIDASLKRLLRQKKKLYRRAKATKDWNKYRTFQKHCKRETRRAEWRFVNRTIQDGLDNNNTKPFWNFVKARRKDNVGVSPLREGNKLQNDSRSKAEILLKQFKSVFTTQDDDQLPSTPLSAPSIDQIQISVTGVAKLLRDLKPHKAPGPDGIPNTVLKTCAANIAPALSLIFQRSLDTGTLPRDWLTANVSPVFKKGDRHSAGNYRPISLTSVPCKILEHIICRHMINHLETHNILTSKNHGFRTGFSCETQLLTTTHDLVTSYDKGHQVDIAILDFSKAFDTVPHRKLIHKLSQYGVTGPLLSWLKCFLTQRSMQVVLEGVRSKSTSVDSGVPQGTVLGPLLFLCHINDLPNAVTSQVRLFADDCLLYREINTFKDHLTLQQDLKNLEQWADTWGMRFNAAKCHILSVKSQSSYRYSLNSTILKHVTNNPYLGILFSQDLRWGDHIAKVTKKANATLGFLRRNFHHCPTRCKRSAYLSLVRSVLEYGATTWDPYTKKDIDALERVQRGAARFISGDYHSRTPGCIQKLLKRLELPPLQDRRRELRLCLLYKIVEGMVPALPADDFLKPQKPGRKIRSTKDPNFMSKNTIDTYLRNNNRCFSIKPCNTDQHRHSFFYQTAVQWNALDDDTVHAESAAAFKNKIGKVLANNHL